MTDFSSLLKRFPRSNLHSGWGAFCRNADGLNYDAEQLFFAWVWFVAGYVAADK